MDRLNAKPRLAEIDNFASDIPASLDARAGEIRESGVTNCPCRIGPQATCKFSAFSVPPTRKHSWKDGFVCKCVWRPKHPVRSTVCSSVSDPLIQQSNYVLHAKSAS